MQRLVIPSAGADTRPPSPSARGRYARQAAILVASAILVGVSWASMHLGLSLDVRDFQVPLVVFASSAMVGVIVFLVTRQGHAMREREIWLTQEVARLEQARDAAEQARVEAEARTRRSQSARGFAEEVSEQKSRFVAIVSHELRTPLSAVVNSLTLLDQSGLSPVQQRLADTARQAGDALLDLVNDILELSKMEAGRLAMRPTAFDVRTVLASVRDMFRVEAESRGIRFVIDVAEQVPPLIHTDSGRLRQVLMNLVGNAAKFSLPGDLTLRASVGMLHERWCLVIGVRDQGPRIPDREAARLFKPFSRLDQAGASGTGLGLAICYRLIRLMGGDIGVATAGAGNEFWLALPLDAIAVPVQATGTGAAAREATAWALVRLPRPRRAHVLLVEDIPANHLLAATVMRREGHRVDVAHSGAEALWMVAHQPYDLVFMDLLMPGMSGQETARRIRDMAGWCARVPIVALTGNASPEDRQSCLAAGMDDLLAKPMRPPEMNEALARIVRPPPTPVVSAAVQTDAAAADTPLVDLDRFADLQRGLPVATLATIVEQCLLDMQQRVPQLRDALSHGRLDAIEMSAHALAGLAASYGLVAIERKMKLVITAARRGDAAAAKLAAADVTRELERGGAAIRLLVRDRAA